MALPPLTAKLGLDTSEFTDGLKDSQGRLRGFADKMSSAGKTLTLGLTAPLVGAAAGLVKLASDAEESMSKFDAVFEESGAEVSKWAEGFARDIGRSVIDTKEQLAQFQDTFVPLGFASEEATKLSKSLVGLTADLGSFHNASDPEVQQLLTSALIGNHEAVQRFGIVLTAASVEQRAFAMTGKSVAKELTIQEKVAARLQLITEGAGKAVGDAARTAGGFANQLKALQGETKDVLVALGQELLPVAKELVMLIRDHVIPSVKGAVEWFSGLSTNTKILIGVITGLVAAIGPLLVIAGTLIKSIITIGTVSKAAAVKMGFFSTSMTTATAASTGLNASMGTGLVGGFGKFLRIAGPATAAFTAIAYWGKEVWDHVAGIGDEVGKVEWRAGETLAQAMERARNQTSGTKDEVENLNTSLAKTIQLAKPDLSKMTDGVSETVAETFGIEIPKFIDDGLSLNESRFQTFVNTVGKVFTIEVPKHIDDGLKPAGARVQKFVDKAGELVSIDLPHFVDDGLELAGKHTISGLRDMLSGWRSGLGGILGSVKRSFTGGGGIKGIISSVFSSRGGIMGAAQSLFGAGGSLTSLLGAGGPWGAGIAAAWKYRKQILSILKGVGEGIKSIFGKVGGFFKSIGGGIKSAGKSIWGGIKGIFGAADGYHGMVNQPTMFLAGERGSERVDITPASRLGGQSQNGGNTIIFNIYDATDANMVAEKVARKLRLQGAF